METSKQANILVVDLDGTLIKTDCLYESLLLLLKRNPLYIFQVPYWILQSKARLKYEIAQRVNINVSLLPFNEKVIQYTKNFSCKKILATGSNKKYANEVATYLGIFDEVIASTKNENILGAAKAKALEQKFSRDFIYIGDSSKDIPVWEIAKHAILLNPSQALIKSVKNKINNYEIISDEKKSSLWEALRPHQWAKNILLFAPLLAAHQIMNLSALLSTLIAVISFSLCASSVYILNDLFDLEDDRAHNRKKERPFASGALNLKYGLALIPILLLSAFSIAVKIGYEFTTVLIFYYGITLAYSLYLKRVAIADTITLSALYIIRMIAGATVTAIPLSFWFLAFGVFLFYSLAVLKRYIETIGSTSTITSRGYLDMDHKLLPIFGISSSYISILILALYFHNISVINTTVHSLLMISICFILLFWYTRLWMLAQRDQLHDDPVVFVMQDRVSLLLGLISVAILYYIT